MIALAGMISADRDALVCDLAETYGIYDFRALPVPVLATLAAGLRDDSRIKMRLTGVRANNTDLLLAAIADRLAILIWQNTKDGHEGANPPKLIYDTLAGAPEKAGETQTFDAPDSFEAEWTRITGVKRHGK